MGEMFRASGALAWQADGWVACLRWLDRLSHGRFGP